MRPQTPDVAVLYVVCFACRGTGKEPDYFGQRTCIWCEGRGRRRERAPAVPAT
jgi:DnaJ-class molecular chaperone